MRETMLSAKTYEAPRSLVGQPPDRSADKKLLEREFYARIPKARRINPVFRGLFEFMYQAHLDARPGTKLLNLYASQDFSGDRRNFTGDDYSAELD